MKKSQSIINWVLGNAFCMLGICFSTKSDFGLSMIAAGPYIVHVALRDMFPWYTQGTSEYFYEAALLIVLCLFIKKFKPRYLLSFLEAILAGFVIDFWFIILGGNAPYETPGLRIIAFIVGLVLTGLGVAFFFRTHMPIQIYDMAVVEVASTYKWHPTKVKQAYDVIMFAISLSLSLLLTRKLTGIGIGTIVATGTNASIINFFGKIIDKYEKK